MSEKPKETDHRSQLRLPAELATWLKHRAVDNSRSLNNEITHRLKLSKQSEETQGGRQHAQTT